MITCNQGHEHPTMGHASLCGVDDNRPSATVTEEDESDACEREFKEWAARNHVPETEDNAWYAWQAAWEVSRGFAVNRLANIVNSLRQQMGG